VTAADAGPLLDHLFRHEHGRLVAALARRLGPAHLALAEDAVAEALLRAARTWPFRGVPERPAAWLETVARRVAVDELRRRAPSESSAEHLASEAELPREATEDDLLRLMLLCCHPQLPLESRLALVLRTASGFSIAEIAAALVAEPEAVRKRLVRARETLRLTSLELAPGEVQARAEALRLAVYLLFNEGYAALSAESPLRAELTAEALRLVRLLGQDGELGGPRSDALRALLCLLAARLPARLDGRGELLALSEQDRSKFDSALVAEGFHSLDRSSRGPELSRYHVEAAIAATHTAAERYEDTDWPTILAHYDQLLRLHPSALVALNRTVALAHVRGADRALLELEALAAEPELRRYPLLATTRAQLTWWAGRSDEAVLEFERAIALEPSPARRRFLERRLRTCRAGGRPVDF
jgi:RNA polymerase sigma-70 factor (ECF subfamily)